MKRVGLILLGIFMSVQLVGCGSVIPELSDDDMQLVEEYAAQTLLKYENGYSNGVMSDDEIAAAEQKVIESAELAVAVRERKAKEEAKKSGSEDEESSSVNEIAAEPVVADIDEFLGLSNVDIEFNDYSICESYPTTVSANDFQGVVRAGNGNALVVVNYAITNKLGEDTSVDIASMRLRAAIRINGNKNKTPLTTLLLNDFLMYNDTLLTGETKYAVMIIEVPAAEAEEVTSLELTIKSGTEKIQTTLL